MHSTQTALVIPAYRPSDALLQLASTLSHQFPLIVVVDDGSGPEYTRAFDRLAEIPAVRLLSHGSNRGKGAALKTGIAFALSECPDIAGVITADADGQHLPEDIVRVRDRFRRQSQMLVLGSRAFDRAVPWRSWFGNAITRQVMRVLVGEDLADTQTGLRAIPREFAASLIQLPTDRYEFELDMLMAAREQTVAVVEEPIQTVYEPGNSTSHFNPLLDSMRIYFVLLRFCSTSLLTAIIDNVVFFFAYRSGLGLIGAQVAGRAVAVLFNYFAVRSAVFCARDTHRIALPKFLALVAVSGTAAYFGIRALVAASPLPVIWAKIVVESLLFFVNFAVQRHWVFPERAGSHRAQRITLWLAVLAGAGALVYGFFTSDLMQLATWSPEGMRRFRIYTVVSVLLAVIARRYFLPVLAIGAVICTAVGVGVVPVLSIALIVLSCMALGRWMFGHCDRVVALMAGLAVWALAIALLAGLHVHYAAVYVSLMAGILVVRRRETVDVLIDLCHALRPPQLDWPRFCAGSLLAFVLIAQWFVVMKPEVSADGLAMHLAIAADFANHHAFTFDFRQFIWALMPMGADYCYALAYMLGGEYAARLLNFVMLTSVAYLIYRTTREWVSEGIALLLAAVFVSAPLVQMVTGSMFVENFVAAIVLSAGVALWQLQRKPTTRGLLLCAFLLGSAIGWKIGVIAIAVVLLPALIVTVVRKWREFGPAPAMTAACLFIVPACLPYGKAYVLSGNPVYPFANAAFSSPYIHEHLRDDRYVQKLTWQTPMQVTFHTNRYYEGQDGSFGFQYILFLPLCLITLFGSKDAVARIAALAGVAGSAVILGIQPNARYLYPALPFLTIGAAAALGTICTLDRRLMMGCVAMLSAIALLNIRFLPTSNWDHRDFFLRPLFAERGRAEYRKETAPIRDSVDYVNKVGGVVVLTQGSGIAGVRAPVYANHWHNYPFRKSVEAARDAADIYGLLTGLKVAHLIAPNAPEPSELKEVPAMQEFLAICTQPEFTTERYSVRAITRDCSARLQATAPDRSAP